MTTQETPQQLLEAFVKAAGGRPLFTWAQQHGTMLEGVVVCTNEAGTGLVVGVFDDAGDGGVMTLPENQVEPLANALQSWWEEQ